MSERMIKYDFWLTLGRNGSVKATKRAPGLHTDERGMHCNVELPLSLFTRPSLQATIQVPAIDTTVPAIDIEAAETALSKVIGATVRMEVLPPEREDESG